MRAGIVNWLGVFAWAVIGFILLTLKSITFIVSCPARFMGLILVKPVAWLFYRLSAPTAKGAR